MVHLLAYCTMCCLNSIFYMRLPVMCQLRRYRQLLLGRQRKKLAAKHLRQGERPGQGVDLPRLRLQKCMANHIRRPQPPQLPIPVIHRPHIHAAYKRATAGIASRRIRQSVYEKTIAYPYFIAFLSYAYFLSFLSLRSFLSFLS